MTTPHRLLTQTSMSVWLAYWLFVLHCAGIISALAMFGSGLNLLLGFVAGVTYVISTSLAGLVVFVPILLAWKGRTRRFSLAFGSAGLLAGLIPSYGLGIGLSMLGETSLPSALANAVPMALFNGAIGLAAGLMTRFWLRKRLRNSLHDSAALADIYA